MFEFEFRELAGVYGKHMATWRMREAVTRLATTVRLPDVEDRRSNHKHQDSMNSVYRLDRRSCGQDSELSQNMNRLACASGFRLTTLA